MADFTYETLRTKTVAELRAIAKTLDHEAVKGYSQLNKEHLLPAVCRALGIEMHEHHHVLGAFNKTAVKARMQSLKRERQEALAAHDHERLKTLRRTLHHLNRQVRERVR